MNWRANERTDDSTDERNRGSVDTSPREISGTSHLPG